MITLSKNYHFLTTMSQNCNDETVQLYDDDNYIYLVILSTDTTLKAPEIIRYYKMRPEIEEDFRQLKNIWKICTFTSKKYVLLCDKFVWHFWLIICLINSKHQKRDRIYK